MRKAETNPDENLTGGQIQKILDTLLYNILRSLVTDARVYDTQIIFALSFISKNRKRKISSVPRADSINHLSKALLVPSVEAKLDHIRQAKLERSFVYVFAKRILDQHYDNFMNLYHGFLTEPEHRVYYGRKIQTIQNSLGCSSRTEIQSTLNSCKEAFDMYRQYVNSVASQYLKMCSTQAKFFVDTNPHNQYDYYDVRQNYYRNLIVAINKYDSAKGALTSYIKMWILNAQTCASSEHEYGIAFRVPPQVKKQMASDKGAVVDINFSLSLDATVEDDEGEPVNLHNKIETPERVHEQMEFQNFSRLISRLAKNADINSLGRLTLDIDEFYSKEEVDQMREHMSKQGLIPKTVKHT
jgi:hypothetical protein